MTLETDPINLAFDADGELETSNGIRFLSGAEAVVLGIRQRLLLFREEWFLNLDAGMPWYQSILGQKEDVAKARDAARKVILRTPGVAEILTLAATFNGATRELTITFEVRTEWGDTASDSLALAA